MKSRIGYTLSLAAALGLAPGLLQQQAVAANSRIQPRLEKEIRHELVMLPYFSVFDNLAFKVDGDRVILLGQVTRPTLKKDAERAVEHVEGIDRVSNLIEVLPLSPMDDQIRRAEYRAIYGFGPLQRYSLNPVAPIRIIVKNGNVSLEGVVANQAEKNMAGIRANGVFGVFSVTNNLRVEG
jgi:hyperosmotically inducible protein